MEWLVEMCTLQVTHNKDRVMGRHAAPLFSHMHQITGSQSQKTHRGVRGP